MARLNVNPTRMELKKLKARLSTAVRGHKLLKDKSDEMIRRFSVIIREDKRLREEVEEEIATTLKRFSLARSFTPPYAAEAAFSVPAAAMETDCGTESIMGVDVPKISVSGQNAKTAGGVSVPYAFPEMTGEADEAVKAAYTLLPKMILLAQTEKAVRMLANEIERNKRRVNALEYVMIPQLNETIKYIKDKLDENERASIVRLMKVKSKA
ncbi:MAG: V-type ATP synthase subunit D [Candidatus Borkfalkiaceae bacterium]|nr:V-type ATP synthase subunit D [Clostridia bacterium]MDY6222643.1 V-type ATP synthase subunit D [Christensenellaceae bacterium]